MLSLLCIQAKEEENIVKKFVSVLLAMLMLFSLAGTACAETYSAASKGFGGDVTVTLTVENGKITACEIVGDKETAGIGSLAVENLPDMIVESNGQVDGVSGATITSSAILDALNKAMVAAGLAEADTNTAISYTPGVYEGSGKGRYGEIKVQVEFSSDKIENITLISSKETRHIGDTAFERVSQQVLDEQTLDVDAVGGATLSRYGVLTAITDCVEQAGGNVQALKSNRVHEEVNTEVQQLDTDVLVVGGGLAGISAAIAARDNGANVILLEREAYLGGSSITSSGILHLGATDIQKAAGIEDTPEDFKKALEDAAIAAGGVRDENQTAMMAYRSNDVVHFLIDNGVTFSPDVSYAMGSALVPRAHRVTPDAASLTMPMVQAAEEKGVVIMKDTLATALRTDDTNRVLGVDATNAKGENFCITAKNTILAAGGYRASNELTVKYLGEQYDGLVYCGMPGTDGAMTEAAINIGADTFQLDRPYLSPTYTTARVAITSNVLSKGGILVNSKGARYCNETQGYFAVAQCSLSLGEEFQYEIFDQTVREKERQIDNMYIPQGLVKEYDTLEALAADNGLDVETLKKSVEGYNKACAGEAQDEFDRSILGAGLTKAPYYCIVVKVGGIQAGGGLKINENCQVMNVNGSAIESLYAAGEVTGGIRGYGYAGGDSLTQSAVTGMVAGEKASDF